MDGLGDALDRAFWGEPATVLVANQVAVDLVMDMLFGRALTDRDFAHLVGAPGSALVRVFADVSVPTLRLLTTHPLYATEQLREIRQDLSGAVIAINAGFNKRERVAPPTFGVRVVAREIRAMQAFAIRQIESEAEGRWGGSRAGYYVWAIMGFNAPLSEEEKRALPVELRGARDLHELVASGRPGRVHWRRQGSGRRMVFDLTPGSRHLDVLGVYLEAKGIHLGPDC